MNNEVVLEIKNLEFSYPSSSKKVINDVSFKVYKGDYTCLIGHNGSGKSTIARLIMGLLEANKGDVIIFNEKLTSDNLYTLRSKLGIVFQNPDNQFIASSVKDDIAFGLENDCIEESKMDDIVVEYAKKVNMLDFLDKSPSLLSGGQKQRVAIAGVLARHPSILIMDEATSMLDPKGKEEILTFINHLKKEDKDLTVISITHDISEAYASDHVVVLDDGKKVLDDIPSVVFKDSNLLKQYKLDVPFYLELDEKLKEVGIDCKNASNIDQLVEVLCK
jgi:energy-coupling factor transport system ATP-binding protein